MGEFCFGQSAQKLPENYEKVLFLKTYIEDNIIN